MKSNGLLSILTFSEKRRDTLFLLLNEPKTLAEIKSYLNISSPEILPRIKELETENLIYKENKKYTLTPIGKVVANLFQSFINTLKVIEKNEDFLKEHMIDDIPLHLLERIGELGNCRLIEKRAENIYDSQIELFENVSKSKYLIGVAAVFNPAYPDFILQLARKKVSMSLILSQNIFEKVKGYKDQLQRFFEYNNSLYVLNDDVKIAFVVTENFFSLSLFLKNDIFDFQRELISFDKSALKWGEELFNFYKGRSIEIRGL